MQAFYEEKKKKSKGNIVVLAHRCEPDLRDQKADLGHCALCTNTSNRGCPFSIPPPTPTQSAPSYVGPPTRRLGRAPNPKHPHPLAWIPEAKPESMP